MSLSIECPHCDHMIEDDPELSDGQTEEFEVTCTDCGKDFLYDIEFWPVEVNVRKIPNE